MRMFAAATLDDDSAPRKAVPADLLRRLAFGRPPRRSIQPALPLTPVQPVPVAEAAPAASDDSVDLDQRVRQSGEW